LLPALLLALAATLTATQSAIPARADAPAFDLLGPKVDIHVQRDGKTLPIAQVPNLLPGDRLWIHPDLPESQSTHIVLVVAFLRGATNPPPPDWYKRVETWNKAARAEGVFVTVPAEAQQAVLFLAPETTGDFNTLKKAVHDRPGAFVRATQDLQQASWDRLRLDTYLAQVKALPPGDAKVLKEHTELAARSLGIKVDAQCFDKPTEQQAPCLVQHSDGLVLDDSNAQSIVTQMANGAAGDMMNQISYSSPFGAGAFSPYVGAVLDVARIMSTLHTAHFQYIPALALPQKGQQDTLNLRLNVPPSFRDPKSVIVVALPPIHASIPPVLHAADTTLPPAPTPGEKNPPPAQASNPNPLYCATKPDLTLGADGAPLLFGTAMAHDLRLHIETKAPQPKLDSSELHPELPDPGPVARIVGEKDPATPPTAQPAGPAGIDIPVEADPSQGGLVLKQPIPPLPESEVVAELRGEWGFDSFTGPKFHLAAPHAGEWSVASSDSNALITGREDTVHLQGQSTLCVEDVYASIKESAGHHAEVRLTWKSPHPEQLEVMVPLAAAQPGAVTLAIHQYGLAKPDEIPLKAYAEAAAIDHLSLNAGDKVALLKGKRLDEVESADLAGITFSPSALNRVEDFDQLELTATGATTTLQPGTEYSAKVTLKDGRTIRVPASVGVARPQVDLLSKGIQHEPADDDPATPQPFRLGSPNDLPLQRKLVFFLKSRVPTNFPRSEKIEVAATDGSFQTTLSLSDGSIILEDAHTAVAVVDPMARFGASAFGPLQFRPVSGDGVAGDWTPLGTLVRLPGFTTGVTSRDLRCQRSSSKPCLLTGSNLFLITEVATAPDMSNAIDIPPDFTGSTISVPNVSRTNVNGGSGTIYVRLRDDPATIQTLSLPITWPAGSNSEPASPAVSTARPEATPESTKTPAKVDSTASTSAPGAANPAPATPTAPGSGPHF
jgi:hypothetical protein